MQQLSSLVGWNQFVMVATAIIGVWYFYDAFTRVAKAPGKLPEALRSFVLGFIWLSVWAVYNPHDFATMAPFLAKFVLVLGAIGFIGSLVWSAKTNFKGFRQTSKKTAAPAQTS